MSAERENLKVVEPAKNLAAALERLHLAAGKPPTRKIAAAVGSLSHTTVADALAGRRVPSWPVLEKIVTSLGGDPAMFRALWVDAAAPSGLASQAVLGSGIQNIYLGTGIGLAGPVVSIAPPFGHRDESQPLRGRDDLLAELAESSAQVLVVHGLGGVGKTRLALEAAYQAQRRGTEVWWMSAADPSGLVAGMHTLGTRLGVPEAELERSDTADAIWQKLVVKHEPWLLVIDNADDPQILGGPDPGTGVAEGRGWLRPILPSSGSVLVTSRDGNAVSWGPWCVRHRLTVLPAEEAADVLADYAGHLPRLGSDTDASALAERLGGLPLALRIAGYTWPRLRPSPPHSLTRARSVPTLSTMQRWRVPGARRGRKTSAP